MSSYASSQRTRSPSSDTGPLADVRSLQRRLSNLSQASTLVGSESDHDDDIGTTPTTQNTTQHDATGESCAHEHCVQYNAAVSAARRDAMIPDFDRVRMKAQERIGTLHLMFDPFMDLINSVSVKMDVAERLAEGGDYLAAYPLYMSVLRDIENSYRL
jgi:hypothetical protein